MVRRPPAQDSLFAQFGGSCPVCGQPLGSPATWDERRGRFQVPPCFRLEVGPPDDQDSHTWRVTAVGVGAKFPPAVSTVPEFVESEVEYIYLLCGDGHIFPQSAPGNVADRSADAARQRVDRWNMVAAIGAPASGKTYLLVRMMSQELDNPHNYLPEDDAARVLPHKLRPLEQVPIDWRAEEYTRTVADHLAIPPTASEETRPAMILEGVLPDAVAAIKHIIRRTVVDGGRRADSWGRGFRQPLVVRTSSDDLLTWTGIADLPGELFVGRRNEGEQRKLRAYDALIWVIDPMVVEAVLDPLAEEGLSEKDDYTDVLDGSLRPGDLATIGRHVRADRLRIQRSIGRSLTLLDGDLGLDREGGLEMLIAISKCDLIHAALCRKKKLTEFGPHDSVRTGVAAYLARTTRRWATHELKTSSATDALLAYLLGAETAIEDVRQQRLLQVVDGLLAHYSHDEAFWRLVHDGTEETVDIAGDGSMAVTRRRIKVPSIGDHLDRSTRKGSGERLLIRDLIMSALGCGIAFGLGHGPAIQAIMRGNGQRLRLFLCSPLATVPIGRSAVAGGVQVRCLEPLDRTHRFPAIEDPSAALSQLFLATLRKARA